MDYCKRLKQPLEIVYWKNLKNYKYLNERNSYNIFLYNKGQV